jgi:hypothetical protein
MAGEIIRPGSSQGIQGKHDQPKIDPETLAKAKKYAEEHNCSIKEAIKAVKAEKTEGDQPKQMALAGQEMRQILSGGGDSKTPTDPTQAKKLDFNA